ncbi:MAG: hypothetical protein ACXW4Z_22150, partial [Candidatus Binatia bacterium]
SITLPFLITTSYAIVPPQAAGAGVIVAHVRFWTNLVANLCDASLAVNQYDSAHRAVSTTKDLGLNQHYSEVR